MTQNPLDRWPTEQREMMERLTQIMEEPLLPELAKTIIEIPSGGQFVHHPLVVGILCMNGLMNHQYQAKKAILDGEPWEPRHIWLYENPYRLQMLAEWYADGILDLPDLQKLLPEVWVNSEYPVGATGQSEWLITLFRAAGFYSDNGWAAPKVPMPVYRGGHSEGMAWTLDKQVATFFAKRFQDGTSLYSAIAPPEAILAIFMDARGESEVVVDPDYLTEVQELALA